MATRKKKTTVIESADVAEMTIDATGADVVKITKGNHLTVKTFPNGHTVLEWDDEALLRDVRAAILKAESVLPVAETKSKRKTKVK
jgi:hypothetical protein